MTDSTRLAARNIDTPIGRLQLAAGGDGLHELLFPNKEQTLVDTGGGPDAQAHVDAAARALDAYFAGNRRDFDDLTLAPQGTDFQMTVWRALRTIPYGETTSYGALAAHIGNPKAMRAVGLANGRNPIPVIVPCHRVIGADGSLTGFGGGLPTKKYLLDLEGALPSETRQRPLKFA